MPTSLYDLCAVKVDQSHIYLIGGHDSKEAPFTDEVYIVNPLDNFSVIQGPSLLNGEMMIQCYENS